MSTTTNKDKTKYVKTVYQVYIMMVNKINQKHKKLPPCDLGSGLKQINWWQANKANVTAFFKKHGIDFSGNQKYRKEQIYEIFEKNSIETLFSNKFDKLYSHICNMEINKHDDSDDDTDDGRGQDVPGGLVSSFISQQDLKIAYAFKRGWISRPYSYYDEGGDPFDPENGANWDGDQQIGFRDRD